MSDDPPLKLLFAEGSPLYPLRVCRARLIVFSYILQGVVGDRGHFPLWQEQVEQYEDDIPGMK